MLKFNAVSCFVLVPMTSVDTAYRYYCSDKYTRGRALNYIDHNAHWTDTERKDKEYKTLS
jgi:hypothetical protein